MCVAAPNAVALGPDDGASTRSGRVGVVSTMRFIATVDTHPSVPFLDLAPVHAPLKERCSATSRA